MSTRLLLNFRLLDLCCGAGLTSHGYWRSGCFSEIVGVDCEQQPSYSFDFIQADALTLDYEFLAQFDFIHASPPCQYYSKATPDRNKHPRLIPATLLMLEASGKPYVVENVEGSSHDLGPNLVINGQYCGLPMHRLRYFKISNLVGSHRWIKMRTGANLHVHNMNSRQLLIKAFGLADYPHHWLRRLRNSEILQGVPPEMTRLIASQVLTHKVGLA